MTGQCDQGCDKGWTGSICEKGKYANVFGVIFVAFLFWMGGGVKKKRWTVCVLWYLFNYLISHNSICVYIGNTDKVVLRILIISPIVNVCTKYYLTFLLILIVTECGEGSFGYNCTNNCSGHCLHNSPCNKQTGHCDGGCRPGYTNADCNDGSLIHA